MAKGLLIILDYLALIKSRGLSGFLLWDIILKILLGGLMF